MSVRTIAAIGAATVSGIVGVTVLLGSWYTIDQGARGVLLRNGAVIGIAQPGLGFKTPWIEDVEEISVQSQARRYTGPNGVGLATYSNDQQPADILVSINYHADPAQVDNLYARYGSLEGAVERLIDPKVAEQVKNVFGRYNAVKAIQDRSALNQEIQNAVQSAVGEAGAVVIDSVQIENIDFSDAYEQSIEQRMLAEVEVQKLKQNAEREKVQADIVVTQATAQANAVRAAAKAEAEAITLRGNAEAEVIRLRGAALRDNPTLIELTQAEKWNGVLPTTMIPSAAVPFLGVK